ncbi:helix-turn-helix domain-containing protein [Actinomadura roseirufa]|uniref:helix-turn-helix domain-containing protein n=1 Tax=Actinomadura roseirufa TaxID=2094049 RepID=UPI001040E94A|nr:helix-turn-helix transcriptional regulator [Actinomadura roseirufa]
MSEATEDVVAGVGARLRRLRHRRGVTLTRLAEVTGISVSALSRLESGKRRPGLELLLPLAEAYQVPLDELVGAPPVGDERLRLRPSRVGRRVVVPLARRPGGVRAYKTLIPPVEAEPEPRSHEGYVWMMVLDGRLRLRLDERELLLRAGEGAEFDTRRPHWLGGAGGTAEVLSLAGPQGERVHMRTGPRVRKP